MANVTRKMLINGPLVSNPPGNTEFFSWNMKDDQIALLPDQGGVLVLMWVAGSTRQAGYDPIDTAILETQPFFTWRSGRYLNNDTATGIYCQTATVPLDADIVTRIRAQKGVPNALSKHGFPLYAIWGFVIEGDPTELIDDIIDGAAIYTTSNGTAFPSVSPDVPKDDSSINIISLISRNNSEMTLYRNSDGAVVSRSNGGSLVYFYDYQNASDVDSASNIANYHFEGQEFGFGLAVTFKGIAEKLTYTPEPIDKSDCNIRIFDILSSLYVATLRYTYAQIHNGRIDGTGKITDVVIGANLTSNYDLEQLVADICYIYNITRKYEDGSVRFYKNKTGIDTVDIVATINEDELAVTDTASDGIRYAVSTEYSDTSSVVTQLAFQFVDADNDYATNHVTAKRPDALQTDELKTISLPFVMQTKDAEDLVNRLLTTGRLSLTTHTFRLPPKYVWIGKGDVIRINHGEFGDVVRITDTDLNADRSQTVTAETVAVATNILPPSSYVPTKRNDQLVNSYGLILDIPALNVNDTLLQGALNPGFFEMYLGVTPEQPGAWVGGYMAQQLPGEAYATLFHMAGQPSKAGGVLCRWNTVEALSNKRWVTDTDTLTLVNASGVYDVNRNTDRAGLDANPTANLAVYGDKGRWEVVQFERIVNGVVSGIRRGLRGTEDACGRHLPGDFFFALYPGVALTKLPVAQLGKVANYKAVSDALLFSAAPVIKGLPFQGNSRRPFAPFALRGHRDVNGDILFTWQRRDRNNTGWGRPSLMSEAVLAFKVDVCDTNGKVLRSLAATDTHVSYSAASQQADGTDTATEISLVVCQLGDIGDGFATRGLIDV